MLQKNDCITLEITDINAEAFGIGRYEGMAVFVPSSAVGDKVRVRILKVLSTYCFGKVEEILVPSPDRIAVDCPVYAQCGGCGLRHISYESECKLKNNWVYQNLSRIGGVNPQKREIIPSPRQLEYRNKAQYPVQLAGGKLQIGFYAKHSHRVVPCMDCRLQPSLFTDILKEIHRFLCQYHIPIYDEQTHRGLVRHIYLRYGEKSDKVMLCLVINGTQLPHAGQFVAIMRRTFPQVVSIVLNVNRGQTNVILGRDNILLFGEEAITDQICGLEVSISPLAFYQVNREAAEILYGVAKEFAQLTPNDVLVDLYCGTGTIGLSMAREAKELIGVEIIPAAIENAKQNAKRNGIENAHFFCDDAAGAVQTLAQQKTKADVVVVDPPRKGCSPQALDAICQMSPSRIVYVSCDSATLARDIKWLSEKGYTLTKVQTVDLFPRTGHVETVARLDCVVPSAQ